MEMEPTPWLLWLSLTISLLYFLLRTARNHSCKNAVGNLPPGPSPLPVVGNLFELGSHPHRSLAALARTHGPVMCLKLGSITTIVVSSPAAAREALQKKDQPLSARSVPEASRVLGQHKVSMAWNDSSSERWKHLRSVYRAHLLSPQRLDAHQAVRQQKMREMVAHVRAHEGRAVDVGRVAFGTVLNLISSTAFSTDMVDLSSASAQEFKELIASIMEETGAPNLADFFPVLRFVDPSGHKRRLTSHFKKLFDIFDEIIDNRLNAKNSSSAHDLLDSLLQLHVEEKNPMIDRATVKSILADVFIAGTDTVSNTVEWAMTELLRHPSAMAKVRAELGAVVGPGREVEESDISGLPYLLALVKETLRYHPPVPLLLPHRAETSVELGGYTVPAGSRLLVNVWAIGRDEEAWEEPEEFSPERFLGSEVDFRGRHFELIPFGSGRRICPGLPLAFRNVHLMLASLLHSFQWSSPEHGEVDVGEKFGVTLAKSVPLQAIALPR